MDGSENNKNDSDQELSKAFTIPGIGNDDETGLTEEDKQIIIFGLGRAYKWCQFNGLEVFAGIPKSKFLETAEKLGAKIKGTEFE